MKGFTCEAVKRKHIQMLYLYLGNLDFGMLSSILLSIKMEYFQRNSGGWSVLSSIVIILSTNLHKLNTLLFILKTYANMKVLINSLWKLDFLQWIKVKNIKEKCICAEKGFMKNLSIQPTFLGTLFGFSEFPYIQNFPIRYW